MSPVRAVLVDLGGVLSESLLDSFTAYETTAGSADPAGALDELAALTGVPIRDGSAA